MEVTLIRHTKVAVEPGICYGWTDVETASSFEEEACQVATLLDSEHFDAVYSSPLQRCRKLAAYCGYPAPLLDDRLKELHFGRWEMQKWDDICDPLLQEWYNDWIHIPAGGAESYSSQCQRVAGFLDNLRRRPYHKTCIFTHRGVIAAALVYAGLCLMENSFSIEIDYGSKTVITI